MRVRRSSRRRPPVYSYGTVFSFRRLPDARVFRSKPSDWRFKRNVRSGHRLFRPGTGTLRGHDPLELCSSPGLETGNGKVRHERFEKSVRFVRQQLYIVNGE